jgi:hypothetical protein
VDELRRLLLIVNKEAFFAVLKVAATADVQI